MKRGRLAGAIISSRTAVRAFFSSKIRLSPRLGMNGNGCAGSIACGVSTGKICSRKCWSSQVSAASSSGSSPTTVMSASSSAAWSSAQTSCWLVTSLSASMLIGCELLGRREAVGRTLLHAQQLVGLEAGDADHEEFVEVACRDRQESQPLEQRMARIACLFEDAAVERQPGQLAVEIARPGALCR